MRLFQHRGEFKELIDFFSSSDQLFPRQREELLQVRDLLAERLHREIVRIRTFANGY